MIAALPSTMLPEPTGSTASAGMTAAFDPGMLLASVQPTSIKVRMYRAARALQDAVCQRIEALDTVMFRETFWERTGGGGGRARVLQGGRVFEKAVVNTSVLDGTMSPEIARTAAGEARHNISNQSMRLFGTGVSMILHTEHPLAPSGHLSFRYNELEDGSWWFGGGMDLTPSYLFEEDAVHFHGMLKAICDKYDPTFYPRFKQWADDYFLIRHRGERRGIGGIMFNNLCDRDPETAFAFVQECLDAFIPAYFPLVERRKDLPFRAEQKHWQSLRRGRYVEFNFIYDRGILFGLKTDVPPEVFLASVPLTARWEYDFQPEPGSHEARTLEVLCNPPQWI